MSLLASSVACEIDSRSPLEASCNGAECDEGASGAGAGGAGQAPVGSAGASEPGGSGGGTGGAGGSGASGAAGLGTTPEDPEMSGGAAGTGAEPSGGGDAGASGDGAASGSSGAGGASGAQPAGEGSGCPTNLLVNGGFEAGEAPWVSFTTGQDPLIYDFSVETYDGVDPHAGLWLGWLGGVPSETNRLSQTVTVPASATSLALAYSLRVQVFEPHANIDFFRVRVVVAGQPIPIAEFTNADAGDDWVNLTPPPVAIATNGQPVTAVLELESEIGAGPGTNFFVDDLALVPTCAP